MFCPQCRSQEIINRDITPIYECSDCGYMFNVDNFILYEENVKNISEKKKSFSILYFDMCHVMNMAQFLGYSVLP